MGIFLSKITISRLRNNQYSCFGVGGIRKELGLNAPRSNKFSTIIVINDNCILITYIFTSEFSSLFDDFCWREDHRNTAGDAI